MIRTPQDILTTRAVDPVRGAESDIIPLHPLHWFAISDEADPDARYMHGTAQEAIEYCAARSTATAIQLSDENVTRLQLGAPDSIYAARTHRFADIVTVLPTESPPTFVEIVNTLRARGFELPMPTPPRVRSSLELHLNLEFILGLHIVTAPLAQQPPGLAHMSERQKSRNPLRSRVLAIGFAVNGEKPHAWVCEDELQEADVLGALWDYLKAPQLVVTFGGLAYDIPFLVHRSLICGVAVPERVRAWFAEEHNTQHFDVDRTLMLNAPRHGSLDDWRWAFRLPNTDQLVDRAVLQDAVSQMVTRREWTALGDHAWFAANSALEIANRVGLFYLPRNTQ